MHTHTAVSRFDAAQSTKNRLQPAALLARLALALASCSALLQGCSGLIVEPPRPVASAAPVNTPNPPPQPSSDQQPSALSSDHVRSGPPDLNVFSKCSAETARGAANRSIERLSRVQLLRTLQVSFPSAFRYARYPDWYDLPWSDVMGDYPLDVTGDANENFNALHSEAQVAGWSKIADRFAGYVVEHWSDLSSYGADCLSQKPMGESCWTTLLGQLGRALWRRPLSSEEVGALLNEHTDAAATERLRALLSRLLQAPQFVFHIALGDAQEGRLRLNDHQVAERLSYGLTDGPPDAKLAQAADEGELTSLDAVLVHARRLVETPLAKVTFKRFVNQWLRVAHIPTPQNSQVPTSWAYGNSGLSELYQQELQAYVDYVVWTKKGTFHDLMTLPVAFPSETKLADVYGVDVGANGEPVSAPDHPGLLLRAGLLASGADVTSPIRRGVTVLRRALCSPLPSPDPTIVASRLGELGALSPRTTPNHEIVNHVTSAAPCSGCHVRINPVGFALEAYDTLGMRKSQQEVRGSTPQVMSTVLASFPLPGPQPVMLEQGRTVTVDSPEALVEAISTSADARSCMAVRMFRYVRQRPEEENDACALAEVAKALEDGESILEAFVRAVANEDVFWGADL